MKQHTFPVPCARWSRALAAVSHDDLSLAESRALAAHLATCPSCSAVQREYRMMDAHILTLPPVEPLEHLPEPVRLLIAEPDDELSLYFVEGEEHISLQRPFQPVRRESRNARLRYVYALCSIAASIIVIALLSGGLFFTAQLQNHSTLTTSQDLGVTPPSTGAKGVSIPRALYNVTSAGQVFSLASVDGGENWINSVQNVTGGLAVFDQMLYIGTQHAVVALRINTQVVVWSSSSQASVNGSLLADTSGVYFGSTQGINALQPDTGTPLWHFSPPGCVQCNGTVAALANGSVYSLSQGLYALSARGGKVLWHDDRFSVETSQVVQASGKLYVNSLSTNQLYVLRADNGKQVATLPGGEIVTGNGIVFVGTQKAGTYALRTSDDSTLWSKPDLYIKPLTTGDNLLYGFEPLSPTPTAVAPTPTPTMPDAAAPTPWHTISSGTGILYEIQANSGSVSWSNNLPVTLDTDVQPLVVGDNLYINTLQGITALSSKNGSILWQNPNDQVFGNLIAA